METLVRKQVEKMKKTFDVETLAGENFSENCPEENPTCAEEDEEKEEKEQAEEDFTIEVKSDGEQKSVIVIDLYVRQRKNRENRENNREKDIIRVFFFP